jgi:hypothetical protein
MCTLGLCVVCCDDGAGAVCLGRCCIVHHALLKYVKNPKLNYNLDSRKSIINYNEVKKLMIIYVSAAGSGSAPPLSSDAPVITRITWESVPPSLCPSELLSSFTCD